MCDTLCVVGSGRTLFAKNSDRPPNEPQVVEGHPRRDPGGTLRTQYLEIPDAGAAALMGSRPSWLWGLEHGVNEHGVAIGNEKVWTIDDAKHAAPALLGMDLVRLGLERARSADEAFAAITGLLEEHGQGGSGELDHDEPYFSSFLIADARSGWVLETSGHTWAARAVEGSAAISNRISLSTDWTRASKDVPTAADFQTWRDPDVPVAIADVRLGATRACLNDGAAPPTPRDLVATLRHHGERPWGAPGSDPADVSQPPVTVDAEGSGVTVCMHIRDYQATTASMVTELVEDPAVPNRAWVALGSPCASVYVPVFPPFGVPAGLAREDSWHRFAALRNRVETDGEALGEIRAALGPVESELWAHADAAAATGRVAPVEEYLAAAWAPVDGALTVLGV